MTGKVGKAGAKVSAHFHLSNHVQMEYGFVHGGRVNVPPAEIENLLFLVFFNVQTIPKGPVN
jgi:hypothetical protein